MLVIEAARAIAPSRVITGGWSWPAITIEATTAIAEIALVSDMSGVWSRRETRVTTPRPIEGGEEEDEQQGSEGGGAGFRGPRGEEERS